MTWTRQGLGEHFSTSLINLSFYVVRFFSCWSFSAFSAQMISEDKRTRLKAEKPKFDNFCRLCLCEIAIESSQTTQNFRARRHSATKSHFQGTEKTACSLSAPSPSSSFSRFSCGSSSNTLPLSMFLLCLVSPACNLCTTRGSCTRGRDIHELSRLPCSLGALLPRQQLEKALESVSAPRFCLPPSWHWSFSVKSLRPKELFLLSVATPLPPNFLLFATPQPYNYLHTHSDILKWTASRLFVSNRTNRSTATWAKMTASGWWPPASSSSQWLRVSAY